MTSAKVEYQDAIEWSVLNDDTEWLDKQAEGIHTYSPSTSAILIADLFGQRHEQVANDLRQALAKRRRHAGRLL